jgi:hypothetical protein
MLLDDAIPPGVKFIEEQFTSLAVYKIASFLVTQEDYKELLLLQKDHLGLC